MKKILFLSLLSVLFSCKDSGKSNTEERKNITAVNEKLFIELGGEKQYVEITGASDKNPVLLFLHGGPGWTQTPHLRYFNADLTKTMTLVAWENSGSGKSFMNNPAPKNMRLAQMVKDAYELTQFLKKKFNKQKIYLAGFSSGSMIGLMLAEKFPEDYEAYISITQVLNIKESIKISRNWIAEQAKKAGDKETMSVLQKIEKGDTTVCSRPMDCFMKQYELLSKYGGAIYKKESEEEIKKAETSYEDYRDYDWLKAFFFSAYALEDEIFNTDLTTIKELKIPVYFLMGRHDWNLPTSLTVKFNEQLTAPKKEIIWFENSGHEPLEEEAEMFNRVVAGIVK